MSDTDTIVAECPSCEKRLDKATHLYRTYVCSEHGPFFHDPELGWLHIGMSGL